MSEDIREYLHGLGFHPKLASFIENRSFLNSVEDVKEFLQPEKEKLHSPWYLHDMEKAVDRLLRAIENQERILVYGDFDVDGLCGASVLYWGLRKAHKDLKPQVYLPDRFSEGHGLNSKAISHFKKEKINLVITADCGMGNEEEIKECLDAGIEVIVTDHHMAENHIKSAFAVVNPWLGDYPFSHLCGTGVAYKLILALLEKIYGKDSESYESTRKNLLDYVAMGTISDLMPLQGENRILVKQGLNHMMESQLPFLKGFWKGKLIRSELGETFNEEHVSFQMAPRLNAASRMETPQHAFDFLTAVSEKKVRQKGQYLDRLNELRKERLHSLKNSPDLVELTERSCPYFVVDTGSEERGLLGLLAAQYANDHQGAALVLGRTPQGNVCASVRSDGTVHVFESLAKLERHFEKFGGHKEAGGFQLKTSDPTEFVKDIENMAPVHCEKTGGREELELSSSELSFEFMEQLLQLSPFGAGFMRPRIRINSPRISKVKLMGAGGKHLSFELLSDHGDIIRGVGFFKGHLQEELQKTSFISGDLSYNFFRSRELQFRLEELG